MGTVKLEGGRGGIRPPLPGGVDRGGNINPTLGVGIGLPGPDILSEKKKSEKLTFIIRYESINLKLLKKYK